MNKTILFLLIFSTITSCSDTDKLNELENRIANIEKQNKALVDSLNSVNSKFIKPFKIYERTVLSELKNSPNQIISDYELLIKQYPNSFWKHEAKNRIDNIEKRKKYWSEKEGWKFQKNPKKSNPNEIIIVESISCPGC